MSARDKTDQLERREIDITLLDPDPNNPNIMTDAEFNMLYDNLEKVGFTDPVLVFPVEEGRFRIVGGHHRVEVAKLLDFEAVPCTVITDPAFDEQQAQFQMVRHNVIHGRMDPEKFLKLYEGLSEQYAEDVLQEAFGFADEKEWQKLVDSTAKSLPGDMQKTFLHAAEEIKTIDGLSALLNRLFGQFGDTLPYGYMLVDFGGKDSIWIRMAKSRLTDFHTIGQICRSELRSMDSIVGEIVHMIAKGELDEAVKAAVERTKPIQLPEGLGDNLPLEDTLATLE
jgi:hypothetical protein